MAGKAIKPVIYCIRQISNGRLYIGRQTGCDHVDGPDGRRQLVNCVEQVIDQALARVATLEAALREIAGLDYKRAATNMAAFTAVEIASAALTPTTEEKRA